MTIKTDGLREATKDVGDLGDRARHLRPALEASVFHWQQSERRRFATGRFRRVSAEWARRKRREGLDPRPMRATGQLESALVNANRGAGVRASANNSTLTVGVRRGRSAIYYAQPLASHGRQAVAFDRQAKTATADTVLEWVVYGDIRIL